MTGSNINGQEEPFSTSSKDDFLDSAFSCFEGVRTIAIGQHEPFEVAKAIKEDFAYLAGIFMISDLGYIFRRYTIWRRKDTVRVAAETVHPSGDITDITL